MENADQNRETTAVKRINVNDVKMLIYECNYF